jgi:hypothetical protein|tara:strand:+ start:575 stop:1012 length:438 start_codon:yes stop_codon:yes gene_type:complete
MGKIKLHKLDMRSARIIATVSRLTEISIKDIRGKSRLREVTNARRISMVLINDILRYNLSEIGRIFGKHHATVLHTFKAHNDLWDVDKRYREFFDLCAAALGVKGVSDSNNKDEIIEKLIARIEYLEEENRELIEQIDEIKRLAT